MYHGGNTAEIDPGSGKGTSRMNNQPRQVNKGVGSKKRGGLRIVAQACAQGAGRIKSLEFYGGCTWAQEVRAYEAPWVRCDDDGDIERQDTWAVREANGGEWRVEQQEGNSAPLMFGAQRECTGRV